MKKAIKKFAAITMVAVLALGVLAGCGNGGDKDAAKDGAQAAQPEIVGVWTVSTVETAGVSVDFAQYVEQMGQAAADVKMEMDVKEDKTFTMDMMGQQADGTWAEKDGKYVLTMDGVDQEVSIADGKLIMEEPTTQVKMTFEKK